MRGTPNGQMSIRIAQAVMQADRSSLDPVLQLGGYQAGESDSCIAAMQRYSRREAVIALKRKRRRKWKKGKGLQTKSSIRSR
ncbi:unnamed protein product [Callosobruchus maculatus]|uniref:Uncharacterized protein n=1 Tax=Callosobruchus maculatus TaxID=64391 RepID=A0A653CIR0_CALMS|nr:unnamed protein product [Callosobruchus maculatus]